MVLAFQPTESHGGSKNTGQDESVCNLGSSSGGGSQSRGGGIVTSETVNSNGDDSVQCNGEAFEAGQGHGEVSARVLHLGHIRNEADVSCIGIADLETGVESLAESWVADNLDLPLPARRGL